MTRGHGPPATPTAAPVGISVPATSANLGPGFDALAAAFDLHLSVWTTAREEGRILLEGCGVEELPAGDDNLVWRAFVAYCDWAGSAVPDVSLRASSAIPLERGLGSSAAAAVAGVALARECVHAGGSDADLIRLVAEFEGHADNAAAALLGGVVVCAGNRFVRLQPAESLRPVLCIPDTRLATSTARTLLPESVPHADAAANGARVALVLAGLTGAAGWEPTAMTDVLHEPARFTAMPATGELVAALRAAGVGACLSGAGPSVLAVVASGDDAAVAAIRSVAGDGWEVRPGSWDRAGAVIRHLAIAGEVGGVG